MFSVIVVGLVALPAARLEARVVANPAASASPVAACTAAEKAERRQTLAAFERTMASQRRAFFRTHKNPRARRAFVRRQEARLRALRHAAACTVTPTGAKIVARISIPNTGGVGVGAGSVWVIDRLKGLLRVDPATNTVVATVPGVVGGAPVVGEDAAWVPSAIIANTLFRVDLATGAVARFATGPSDDEWPITAVVTPAAVWVGNHHGGTVARVDPRTNTLVANVPWGEHGNGGIYHMTTTGTRIWVTGSRTSDVAEIDAATNVIVRRTPVPTGTCGGMDVDDSAVWVTSGFDRPYTCWAPANRGVSRIDRATGAVTRIDVGGRPIDVRVAFGSVWVLTDAPTLELVRLDPQTYDIVGRVPLTASRCVPETTGSCPGAEYATALAVGFDSLWARISAPGDAGKLLRIEPATSHRYLNPRNPADTAPPRPATIDYVSGTPGGGLRAQWTLPAGSAALTLEVASKPFTSWGGFFWQENVVLVDRLIPAQVIWDSPKRLDPGTYWIHVETFDAECSGSATNPVFEDMSCLAWSRPAQVTIQRPQNRRPTLAFVGWTSQRREVVTRVCDDTKAPPLTFRATIRLDGVGRGSATRRRTQREELTPTSEDGRITCGGWRVVLPSLSRAGRYTMVLTVTDSRGARSNAVIKHWTNSG